MMRNLSSLEHPRRQLAVAAIAVLLGWRTAYFCARYFGGDPAIKRFHLETTTLWFVAACLVAIAMRPTAAGDAHSQPHRGTSRLITWLAFVGAAAALYFPAMSVGLLSDDFILADRAYRFSFGAFNSEAFRPLPLAVWSVLLHIGLGPATLHAVNIALHGTNAYLTMRVVAPLLQSQEGGLAAASLVLTMPVSVEAVTWCSGVFDLSATMFIALSVLASRAYEIDGSGARVRLIAYAAAGMMSKETAVVMPVLVAADAWVRGSLPRRLRMDIFVLFAAMVAIAVVRLSFASAGVKQPVSKYVIQRWVFGTFAGLAVPWHIDLIARHPWIPTMVTWILVGLLTAFLFRTIDARSKRLFLGMSTWVVVGTAPTLTFFYVGADLQSSRYLYLSAVGWAGLLVTIASSTGALRWVTVTTSAALIALILLSAYAVRTHLTPWTEAAAMRMAFERAAAQNEQILACRTLVIRDPPDSVRGAYVLRNGSVTALKRDIGFKGDEGAGESECSFRWDVSTQTLRSLK